MTHLVQILLPLYDNTGVAFPSILFKDVQGRLAKQFHGLTAYSRVAAEGFWRTGDLMKHDEIVVYEVMTRSFNLAWWKKFRKHLEKDFRQDSIVIRAQSIIQP